MSDTIDLELRLKRSVGGSVIHGRSDESGYSHKATWERGQIRCYGYGVSERAAMLACCRTVANVLYTAPSDQLRGATFDHRPDLKEWRHEMARVGNGSLKIKVIA